MTAADHEPSGQLPSAGAGPADGRFDAFVSYRRVPGDEAFVDRLEQVLRARGTSVWVDRVMIEPAADWLERVTRGIDAARALIFVITPESAMSPECRREFELAVQRNKLVIPIVLRRVDHQDLPEGLARLNWISFGPGHDEDRAFGDLTRALEEDLGWRDAHARLGVKAAEWSALSRDGSYLLRRRDLRAAEEWLGQASQHVRTPPTPLQAEYIAASRKAASRTQRMLLATVSAGLAIAVVAYVQRDQARTQARRAQARALAAQATADLASDPGQSLSLALSAMKLDSSPAEEQALRQAVAQDRLRMAIRSGTGSATVAAWNMQLAQVAVTAPHDSVALWDTATGRLTQTLPTGHTVDQVLYDADGSRLAAVSASGYVSMWTISADGTASPVDTSRLNRLIHSIARPSSRSGLGLLMQGFWVGRGSSELGIFSSSLPDVLAFNGDTGTANVILPVPLPGGAWGVVPSPDGVEFLAAGFGDHSSVVDLATRHQAVLSPQPYSFTFGPMCWLPDGSAVAVSTTQNVGGPVQLYSRQGALTAQLPRSHGPVTAVACSTSTSDGWLAAGDERGDVWLRLADGTVVPLYGHNTAITAIASSPDGRYLATASRDGTARIWNAATGQLVTTLGNSGKAVTGVQFGGSAGLALTVDTSGVLRVWDTGVGQPVTTLQRPARGLGVALGFTSNGQQVTGAALVIPAGTDSRVTLADALTWDARTGRLVREVPLPGITGASPPCSPRLAKDSGIMFGPPLLSASQCEVPPPPALVMAAFLARQDPGTGVTTVMELLPLATSRDGRYTAYSRSRSVVLIGANGREVATLPLDSALAGLSFYDGAAGLLAMTDTTIYLWHPLSGRPPLPIRLSAAPIDAAVSANGNRLAVAGGDNTVSVWDTSSGRLIRSFQPAGAQKVSLRVAITGDGNIVAAGDSDGVISFWNVATGKLVATDSLVATGSLPYPITELTSTPDGARFVAADLPQVVSGPLPPGDGAVLDSATGKVLARYTSPETPGGIVYPDATLSPDGGFLLAGTTGLAPAPPGGFEAAYQVSTGQAMTDLQAVTDHAIGLYSEYPVRPWAPDGSEVLSGTAIYACDACANTSALLAAAASRIAWSRPLSAASDHPPATSPYS